MLLVTKRNKEYTLQVVDLFVYNNYKIVNCKIGSSIFTKLLLNI